MTLATDLPYHVYGYIDRTFLSNVDSRTNGGTASWEGGDPACDHLGDPVPSRVGFNERYFGTPAGAGNKQDALRQP